MPNSAAREAINLIYKLRGAGKLGLTQQSVIYLESNSSSKNWLETWLRPVVNSGISDLLRSQALLSLSCQL